jgi:hypothetical protein
MTKLACDAKESLQIKEMSVLHQTPINNFAASAKHFVSMFLNPLSN